MITHPNPRVQGLLNEDRFFEIIHTVIRSGSAPDWFFSIRRATRQEDLAGVDGFARIYNLRGELTQVPFQVKSQVDLIAIHYQEYKVFWMDRLPYFIINPDIPDRVVRERFFEELHFIRRRNEVFRRVEEHLAFNGAGMEIIAEVSSERLQNVDELPRASIPVAAE